MSFRLLVDAIVYAGSKAITRETINQKRNESRSSKMGQLRVRDVWRPVAGRATGRLGDYTPACLLSACLPVCLLGPLSLHYLQQGRSERDPLALSATHGGERSVQVVLANVQLQARKEATSLIKRIEQS